MTFIFVSNVGVLIYILGRIVELPPFNWDWLYQYDDYQFILKMIGLIICHFGIIFSFNATQPGNPSKNSNKTRNKISV